MHDTSCLSPQVIKNKIKKTIKGIVWSGFIGEYKKPPIYIIQKPYDQTADGIFIDDILRRFLKKKVEITIKKIL
jgi:hypothetical protein